MHFRVPIAVATIGLLLAASVAAQTASGTETMADVTSTTLAVTSVEAVTLQRLTVSDAVTVQSAGPGTAACTLTIENSTIGRLRVTATQFRCRVVITRCTIGSSAVTTAVEYTSIGDSSSSTVEIRSSTLTGRTAAYRIPTISGQHTIANTTLNIGHSSSSYGNAVWVSSQLTGALKLSGSAISVTGFSSSTSSGIYVGTMTGASFLLDDTTITVRNNRNTRGLYTSRATSSCLMIKNSKMDLACQTSCSSTGYSGVYAVSLVGSSFTVADSELKLSTPGGYSLYTSYVFDSALSVRNVQMPSVPPSSSTSHYAWYFYRFLDSKAFLTESRIEGSYYCFRYPSSSTSGTSPGSIILANNVLECETSSASSSTPSYASVAAQCNTLQGGAVARSQQVYGFGTVLGCGEQPSVLSLSDAPSDAAGELQTCSAFGSVEPFSLSSSRSVEVTKTAVYENEAFGTVTLNGATSVVLRNCTVSTLLLKLNAVALQLLVEQSTIAKVISNTQVLGNVTFVDTDIGNALTSQAVYFAQGTSSTSTLTVLNTNISATVTGAIFGAAYGRASFVRSRIIVRGAANPVRGIEYSSYLYGGLNITRCTIEVNATLSGGARAIYLFRTRSGVHIEDSTLKANTVTGTAIVMYLYYVESNGCVYVTGGSMSGFVSSTAAGTAYGLYLVSNTHGAVTLAQEVYVKADGYSASYGAYIQNMYADSILLMNSAELVASSRGRKSTLNARALFLRYLTSTSATVLESTTLRSAEGACLYLPISSTNSPGVLDIRGVYLAECYRNSVYQSSTSYVRIAQNCLRLPGPVTTAAPIGYSATTTVFPCENNKPRTTLVVVASNTANAAATCAAFGSISPFRPPIVTTLSGTVTRSNEFLGALTIVNPGVVTLTNIQATSITFTKTSRRVEGERRAATTRVVIQDSSVGTGGIKLATTFAGMEFTIERTTITATDVMSSVYLLYIHSMSGGSFTVRDSTLKGRRMFYNPSTITDAKLVFQNTSFSATECTCSSDTHLNFYGRLLRTKVTFDGCSIRSISVSTIGTRTAIAFDYLDQATVTVNNMNAYMQHYAATRFVYVDDYRKSCVTVANSSVTQACAEGSTSNSACRSATSTFFYVYRQPTANSFLTLDNIQLNMYSYYGWGVYMRYLRYIDVVINKVTASMAVRSSSSYFLYGPRPIRSVVAVLGSRVTMNTGYIYRFSTVTYTSLLNVRNTFSSSRTMYSSVSRLNGKHGCNTYLRSNSQYLGSAVSTCSPALPAPCTASSSIYSALGISANKEYGGGSSSSSSSSSSSGAGSKVWIIGPVLGGCFVIGFFGYSFFQQQCNNDEEDNNNNADNADAANNDNHEVGNEHALFEDVNEQELQNFNLGDNNVEGAQIFQEAPNDDARLNELVRNQLGGPPAAVPLGAGGGAAAAAAHGLGDVGAQRSEVLTAEDDVIHPLIIAQQELAAVTRGETAPPVEIPLPYAEYATKAFERCRWRSPDGRSASFQAHDLYAGILYPYALSVTAYGDTSDVPHRLGLDYAAWARAIQGASGPTVYGVCVRRVETAAEGRRLMEHAGLRGDWMCSAGTFFVFVVTPFEPERLSVQALLAVGTSPTTSVPAGLSPAHRQVIAARVAAVYSKARSEGIHCALHPAAVFVDPHEQTVSLKDRRADGMPNEAAAAAELLEFVRSVNPDADRTAIAVSVADAVAIARAGAMTPEPSLAFLDDGSFPIKVDAECSICYCEMTSADAHMMGAECCSPARHFVCEDCINMRVSAALTDAKTDFTSLPCAMAPACTSVWTFDDFGALVSPQNLRKWHKLSVQHAQQEAQRQAQANMEALQQQLAGGAQVSAAQAELRRHVTEVRRCLRPACPHCGMPFESFTGCLAVKCGAQDNNGRQVQGCGKEFCGACMVPTPCAKRCGHRFVSPGQLHTLWQGWRREKVQQYLRANFRRGPQDQHRTDEERDRMLDLALRAVRADLVTASIHPLGDGFPNPQ